VNVSRQSALDPAIIQRARAAAGYHGEEQNQEQSASNSAVVQHTGLASSDAARNNLADEMEEDSRSKKRRKMGTKPTCIREQHDTAVRNARFQLHHPFHKLIRENIAAIHGLSCKNCFRKKGFIGFRCPIPHNKEIRNQ
jgi:hypothetical protein